MKDHVKILAVLHIVLGALGVLIGLGVFAVTGGVGMLVAMDGDDDAQQVLTLLGGAGGFVLAVMLVLSVPGIVAGIGLLSYRPWARILTIVISVLDLMNIPFGTALGIYGLWVLLSRDGERLFEPRPIGDPHGFARSI